MDRVHVMHIVEHVLRVMIVNIHGCGWMMIAIAAIRVAAAVGGSFACGPRNFMRCIIQINKTGIVGI